MKKKNGQKASPALTERNIVAKHAASFNKSQVFKDKKVQAKKGYRKHKKQEYLINILSAITALSVLIK